MSQGGFQARSGDATPALIAMLGLLACPLPSLCASAGAHEYYSLDYAEVTLTHEGQKPLFDGLNAGMLRAGVGSDWLALESHYGFGLETAETARGSRIGLAELFGLQLVPGIPVNDWLEVKFPLGYTWISLSGDGAPRTALQFPDAGFSYGVRGLLNAGPCALGMQWSRWSRDNWTMSLLSITLEFRY